MSKQGTITFNNEQYVLLTEVMKLAKVQQRYKLGEMYRGEVPIPGGEKFITRMEKKIDRICELANHVLDNVEWFEEQEPIDIPAGWDHLNDDRVWVPNDVYERIRNNPNEVYIESQGKPFLIVKVIGEGVK